MDMFLDIDMWVVIDIFEIKASFKLLICTIYKRGIQGHHIVVLFQRFFLHDLIKIWFDFSAQCKSAISTIANCNLALILGF